MKQTYLSKLFLTLVLLGLNWMTHAQVTSFSFNGSMQIYTVPLGVTQVSVDLAGASGGNYNGFGTAGYGGRVRGMLSVTGGELLYIYLGAPGATGCYYSCGSVPAGGSNSGGGAGGGTGSNSDGGAAGGGSSDIRTVPYSSGAGVSLSSRVFVGGGGSGVGWDYGENGEAGGYPAGGNGYDGSGATDAGYGGSQTAGGTGFDGGQTGLFGQGGAAYCCFYGSGGGGGWWGGGGAYSGSGGGGSSTAQAGTSGVNYSNGYQYGNGYCNIAAICGAGTITGTASTCVGFSTQLTDATTGVTTAWSSTNTAVATVSATGLVSGLSSGTTTISYGGTFACGVAYSSVVVNVTAPPNITGGSTTVCQTQTTTLTATSGGTSWGSSNTAVATATLSTPTTGTITGVSAGSAIITYFVSASCYTTTTVTVLATNPITGSIPVCAGLNITLSDATAGGTWSSSNNAIGTVLSATTTTGTMTGVSQGVVTISYTQPNTCVMTTPVTVNPLPVAIGGPSFAVCNGLSVTLTDGTANGTWSSSNVAVATIGSSTGKTTGASAGTAAITYTLPTGCLINQTFTVNPLPAAIVGNPGICVGLSTTLTDPTAGGTWSSSATAIGTIASATGVVGGVSLGATTITYTLTSTGCIITLPFNVSAPPVAITGATTVCAGSAIYLSDLSGGGVGLYSTTGSSATVVGLTGLVTGVTAGTEVISYTLPNQCFVTTTVTVNQTPTAITGAGLPLCSGHSATLGSTPGGTWTSSNPFQATVDPVLGVLTGVSAGNPMITYSLPDGCQAFATTTINNSPAPIGGTPYVCKNSSTILTDATPGGTWNSSFTALVAVNAITGSVNGLNVGVPTVSYTLSSNGCYATVSFSVNALPNVETMGGGGGYCIGDSGVHITLGATTQNTVNYYLYNGSSLVGSLPGNGGVLDYGLITTAGTYTVQATTAAGCSSNLPGSKLVTVNLLPAQFNLILPIGGSYCEGGAGVDIMLDGSENLTYYYLYLNDNPVAYTFMPGTGLSLDYGTLDYPAGTYTALAVNDNTGCQSNMLGSAIVNINTIPDVDTVIGGGSYCPYGSGVHVGLDYSSPGINYTLWGTDSVTTVSGASSALDFGLQVSGSYSVTATNPLTGCTAQMYGNATVSTNLTPSVYSIGTIGNGSYCAGTGGVELYIAPSDASTKYQLYYLNTPIGTPVTGTGDTTYLGMQTLDSTYTVVASFISTGCYADMSGVDTVRTLPLPTIYPMTGGGPYCSGAAGSTIGLGNSDNGISYQIIMGGTNVDTAITGTGSPISFGMYTTAGTYNVVATNATTGCQANMSGAEAVSINALPTVYNVIGGGGFCAGGTGVHVGVDHSATGIQYTLYNGTTSVTSLMGSNSELDFGLQTVAGNYKVMGMNNVTGCTSMMNDSQAVVINPQPTNYTVSSTSSSYCIGGAGVHINLTGSDSLLSYQLYLGGVPVDGPMIGTGSALDFGAQTGAGAYTVIASNLVSNCSATMSASPVISINMLPQAFNVTGGGSYCAGGSGVNVSLNGTVSGINYQLYNSTGTLVSTITGTGSAMNFANQTGAGWYKAVAVNPLTTCMNTMFDSAQVNINPQPSVYLLTGGGGYCEGAPGTHIGLNSSSSGISYQLYNGSSLAATVSGSTGSSIDFGLLTAVGSYSVVATDMATGCTDQMSGSKTISVNPLPPVYTMFGGGGYCAGTPGVHVNLSGSTLSLNYQLYFNGVATGSAVAGSGAALDFGLKSLPGNYTAIATDPATNCTSNMSGISMVVINPLPAVYNVTGGGSYCAGTGTGVTVGVDNSDIGFKYQLYNGTTAVGSPISGSGAAINFVPETAAGTYFVSSTNSGTSCTSTMAGSAAIAINPVVVPSVSLSTGLGVNICAGNVLTVTASPTNGGSSPSYLWKVNGTTSGVGNSLTYVPSNGDMVTAILTSNENCAFPATASSTTLIAVAPYETPAVAVTATPGNTVCTGTPVSYNATPSYGGSEPTYTWLKNNSPVGTGLSYSYTPADGDVISFMLNSTLPCRTADVAFSNTVLMSVDQPLVPVVTISATPATTISAGEAVTLHANVVNAGPSAVYQWYVNGVALAGANGQTLESSNFMNNDSVSCVVSSSNVCGNATATNSLIMNVGTLSVNQASGLGENINVIPNPNNGSFTVKGTLGAAIDETVNMEVTDVLGQVVYSSRLKVVSGMINEQIELKSVANGMYLLNLHTNEGVAVFHIVVEK